jgi:hypothetical protein
LARFGGPFLLPGILNMRKNDDSFVVQIASAIVMDGDIIKAGELIEVSRQEAESLLHRGKAVLADESMLAKLQEPEPEPVPEPEPAQPGPATSAPEPEPAPAKGKGKAAE